jgi:hypothetical protein
MLILKAIIFVTISTLTLIALVRHTNNWAIRFREYMAGQARKVFGDSFGWDGSFGLLLSKAMVVFFGLSFIVFVYVVCFTVWTYG